MYRVDLGLDLNLDLDASGECIDIQVRLTLGQGRPVKSSQIERGWMSRFRPLPLWPIIDQNHERKNMSFGRVLCSVLNYR